MSAARPGPLSKDDLIETLMCMASFAEAPYPVRPYQILDCGITQIFVEPEKFRRTRKVNQDYWKPSGNRERVKQHSTKDTSKSFRCTNGNVNTQDKMTRLRYQKCIKVDADGTTTGPAMYYTYKAAPKADAACATCAACASAPKTASSSHEGSLVVAGHPGDVHNPLLTLSHGSASSAEFVKFSMNGAACGNISSTDSGGVVMTSSTGDFAEWHEMMSSSGAQRDTLPEGSVVGFYEGKINLCTKDAKIMGIVSGRPIVLGSAPGLTSRTAAGAPIAYCGRVPVRVLGPVAAGDVLVPSGRNDGTAMVLAKAVLQLQGSCMGGACSAEISTAPGMEHGGGTAVAVAMVSSAHVGEALVHASITPPAMTKDVVQQLWGKTSSQHKSGVTCATLLAVLLCTVCVLTVGRPLRRHTIRSSTGPVVSQEPTANVSSTHQLSPMIGADLAMAMLVRTTPTLIYTSTATRELHMVQPNLTTTENNTTASVSMRPHASTRASLFLTALLGCSFVIPCTTAELASPSVSPNATPTAPTRLPLTPLDDKPNETRTPMSPSGQPTFGAGLATVVLRDPLSMDTTNLAHMIKALKTMTPPPTIHEVEFEMGRLSTALQNASALIVYSQTDCYLHTSDIDRAALKGFVASGGLLVVLGDSPVDDDSSNDYTCNGRRRKAGADAASWLLASTFGWTGLAQATTSPYKQYGLFPPQFDRQNGAKGTVFEAGPATLSGTVEDYAAIYATLLDADKRSRLAYPESVSTVLPGFGGLVNGSRVIYRLTKSNGEATPRAGVWMAPFGDGTVVYFGWNWRTSGWHKSPGGKNWTSVLHLALGLAKNGQRALSKGEM